MEQGRKSDGFVDLHIHTTYSDGTCTPEEIIELAHKEGIQVLAITDHDEVGGLERAIKAAEKYGIKVIPGIECGADFSSGNCHILGYNIDVNNEGIKAYSEERQRERNLKITKMVEKLNNLGMSITFEDVEKQSEKGSLGRPHIAMALVEKGYVTSVREAFEKYIGNGKPAYYAGRKFQPEYVINVIKNAGGIPVLAHPFQMKFGCFEETIVAMKQLMEWGIEGVEVVYPEHSEEENYALTVFALENNLFVTCGSDFHGANKSIKLGNCFFNRKKLSLNGLKHLGKTFV